jgi:hypothetical protein
VFGDEQPQSEVVELAQGQRAGDRFVEVQAEEFGG